MALAATEPIESARTRLRSVERSDLGDLMQVNGDEQVTRFLPYATWTSTDDAQAWYDRIAAMQATGTALQFVLVDKATNRSIGTVLLFRHDEGSHRAELGYVLGRAHWGRGLMLEALHALVGQAFGALDLRRLEAEVNPANSASVRLLERLGFTREGLLRQRWVARQQPYDVAVFGLLRDEYAPPPVAGRGA